MSLLKGQEKKYKVYTALLTQTGGDNPASIYGNEYVLTVGVTYTITEYDTPLVLGDFTNVGSPNNELGTSFVATGTIPNSWGTTSLTYNTGAPVVTVLENTIGNIWFTYQDVGGYSIKKTDNWDDEKTWYGLVGLGNPGGFDVSPGNPILSMEGSILYLITLNNDFGSTLNNQLNKTPIEIRVYN